MNVHASYNYKAHCEVDFFQCSGCSMIGLDRFTYYHYIRVERESLSSKALLHMLFHVLGRYHEHERADRGKYIDIINKNIIEGI